MARVPENADKSSLVVKVTANDRDEDSHLTYSIVDGNVGSAFEVVADVGEIKVRAALDYETGPRVGLVSSSSSSSCRSLANTCLHH